MSAVVRLVRVWFPLATYVKDILSRSTKINNNIICFRDFLTFSKSKATEDKSRMHCSSLDRERRSLSVHKTAPIQCTLLVFQQNSPMSILWKPDYFTEKLTVCSVQNGNRLISIIVVRPVKVL